LDFEFAGFSPNEESTNDAIVYSDDWPVAVYRVFPEELEGLERGHLCEVTIRNRGKRPTGLCRSSRTMPLGI
jgi:hypothetical protein